MSLKVFPATDGDVSKSGSSTADHVAVWTGTGYAIKDGGGTLPVKATGAEIITGTNDTKFATPKALADSGQMLTPDNIAALDLPATASAAPDGYAVWVQDEVVVAGAGTGAADGAYGYVGQHYGYPFYTLTGTNPLESSCVAEYPSHGDPGSGSLKAQVLSDDGTRLYSSRDPLDTYDSFLLALQDLVDDDGTPPAPSVTAQPSTSGITREVLLGYREYTALLTQSSTDPPVATVLANTLGGVPIWSYVGVGLYRATLNGAFLADTTVPAVNFSSAFSGDAAFMTIQRGTDDVVDVTTKALDGAAINADGSFSVTIRVYI